MTSEKRSQISSLKGKDVKHNHEISYGSIGRCVELEEQAEPGVRKLEVASRPHLKRILVALDGEEVIGKAAGFRVYPWKYSSAEAGEEDGEAGFWTKEKPLRDCRL